MAAPKCLSGTGAKSCRHEETSTRYLRSGGRRTYPPGAAGTLAPVPRPPAPAGGRSPQLSVHEIDDAFDGLWRCLRGRIADKAFALALVEGEFDRPAAALVAGNEAFKVGSGV